VTRNIKVSSVSKQPRIFNYILYQIQVEEEKTQYGEVQFFFYAANKDCEDERNPDAYALVSFYRPRDEDMYEDSFGCLWACTYSGNTDLAVIKISVIQSVISMQPLPQAKGNPDGLFFVVEKLGLDDDEMKGYVPEDLVQMQD
jgi:hypothetical protein